MARRLGIGLLVLAATVAAVFVSPRPGLATTGREDHLRAEIAHLLNGERAQRGLGQLPVDAGLAHSAQAWAERNRSVGCEPPTDCHSPDAEAEILAWGVPESRTGEVVVAWMRSSVHRDLLLHARATAVGVGFACSDTGEVYAAVHFAGVRKPVPATAENPVVTTPSRGSACTGAAAPLTHTAPPSTTTTTTTTPAPSTTRPTSGAPPAPKQPPPRPRAPVVAAPVTTAPPSTSLTPTTSAPTTTTSTTEPARVGLSAAPFVADDGLVYASEASTPGPRSESAFVGMLVVVVFLSVLRVGFQLRDVADARAEESVSRLGL